MRGFSGLAVDNMVNGLPADDVIRFSFPCKTTNPSNGATGNTKWAGIRRTNTRRAQRHQARMALLHALQCVPYAWGHTCSTLLPCKVLVRRVAPSNGLDPHDGLPQALKSIVDGLADALCLANDRDPRVTWEYDQRRGPYGVEVEIRRRDS